MIEDSFSGSIAEVELSEVTSFFQHGWHSWCASQWVSQSETRQTVGDQRDRLGHDDPLHALDTVPGGSGLGAVEHAGGQVTLLGALAGGAWVQLEAGRLVGKYEDDSGPWVILRGPEIEVFRRYAQLLGEHLGRRGGTPLRLWASWYSYYGDITETLMHETLTGLEGLDIDVIQVDDGWERAIGDWVPNDDFPSGMADMAARINDTGRNRFSAKEISLSRIFEWFAEDFEKAAGSVVGYVRRYHELPEGARVSYLDYDWTMNAQPGQRPA